MIGAYKLFNRRLLCQCVADRYIRPCTDIAYFILELPIIPALFLSLNHGVQHRPQNYQSTVGLHVCNEGMKDISPLYNDLREYQLNNMHAWCCLE